jgi:Gpi18-like mannosyltransferase
MRELFKFNSFKNTLVSVSIWRVFLYLIAIIVTVFYTRETYPFPYVDTILLPTGLPQWIWGFANFDGVHYLRTSLWGYTSQYSQAFFPLFSLLMWGLSSWNTLFEQRTILLLSGLLISFISTIGGFYFLQKIYAIEYSKKYTQYALLLLFFFPTAFYFFGVYTESLFLLLGSAAVYLILKKKYLYAAVFIALASATKVIGIFLVAVYFIEVFRDLYANRNKEHISDVFIKILGLIISVSGLILYMFYLFFEYNDALYFMHAQPIFGTGRQVDMFISLPQVFYRYLKIVLTVPFISPQFFTAVSEILFSIFGLLLLIFSFRKVRFSFWIFSLGAFILPTVTGTFTSMPRYVLMTFLLFPVFAEYTYRFRKLLLPVFVVSNIVMCAMFVLGFWIA